MTGIHFDASARAIELMLCKHVIQVNFMAFILFIYSFVLALGLWQEKQNQDQNQKNNQGC